MFNGLETAHCNLPAARLFWQLTTGNWQLEYVVPPESHRYNLLNFEAQEAHGSL